MKRKVQFMVHPSSFVSAGNLIRLFRLKPGEYWVEGERSQGVRGDDVVDLYVLNGLDQYRRVAEAIQVFRELGAV